MIILRSLSLQKAIMMNQMSYIQVFQLFFIMKNEY